MQNLRKILSLLLCACLALSAVSALAEDAAPVEITEAVPVANGEPDLNDADVIATVAGRDVTWADAQPFYDNIVAQYSSSYDMTQQDTIRLFRSVAMANAITMTLISITAEQEGLAPLTDEETAALYATSDESWQAALDNYVANNASLTDASTDEEKAAAYAEAEKYYGDLGYTQESLRKNYVDNEIYNRVYKKVTQDVSVTDEDVEAEYQSKVAADKALYENDIAAYESYNQYVQYMAMYASYYGTASDLEHAWYKPNGFRAVKHILLPVDDALMTRYTDLQARLEEQMNAETETTADPTAEPAADPEVTPEPTQEPVSQADLDMAKSDILASLAAKTEEIYAKLADGADFDALIAEYGVKADGTASDPGMTSEPYKTSGYEVSQSSSQYAPEFVEAAFSVENVGDVSAPFISSFGVHIVKYIGDVEGGPIAMTDDERAALKTSLLTSRQDDAMMAWENSSEVSYSGLIPSMAELEAAEAAANAEAQTTEAVDEADAQAAVDAQPEETTAAQ